MNREEGISFVYRIPINKCRSNVENTKSTLEHHSNNCHRQDLPKDMSGSFGRTE